MNHSSTIAVCVLLSACASQSYWYHPNIDMETRHKDQVECQRDAWHQQMEFVEGTPKPKNLSAKQAAGYSVGAFICSFLVFDAHFGMCMKVRGYQALSKKEYHAAIAREASRATLLTLDPEF